MVILIWIKRLLFVAAFAYAFVIALAYFMQRSFVYFPDTRPIAPDEAGLVDFKALDITSSDLTLKSWWHAPEASQPVVLMFHGNAAALENRAFIMRDLQSWGFGVLGVGYPGYGGNAGKPSEANLIKTARANYDWLIQQGIDPNRIVIFGASLGGGVAMSLAPEVEAAGLVLEATFTGADDLGAKLMPLLPVKILAKDRWRNIDRAPDLKMPLSWYHGTRDEVIPFEMGKELFEAFPARKCATVFKGGYHNDLWGRGAGELVKRSVIAFAKNDLPC